MQNILEKLFNGKLEFDKLTYPHDREKYKEVTDRQEELERELDEKLSSEDKKLLEAVLDANMRRAYMETDQAFVCGFKLAALLVIECFTE